MAERIHVYVGKDDRRYYSVSNTTAHKSTVQLSWAGVSGPIQEAKNLTLKSLEALPLKGEKDLKNEPEETGAKPKKLESVSVFIRRLAEEFLRNSKTDKE